MEVITIDTASFLGTNEKYVELKVRKKEFNYDYYVFPKHVIEKTISALKKSNIYCDDISGDSHNIQNVPLAESMYSVEAFDESDCVAVHSEVDIDEIYQIIDYIDQNPDKHISIVLFKNSELPEFKELLSDAGKNECSVDMQAILKSYMKLLLDMSVSELTGTIMEYSENASFGKLLNMYSEVVVDYILDHVTKRFETELRKEMLCD